MAYFKTTFVATVLLHFCLLIIGCAQQYENDYSAEVKFSDWQSSRTIRTRGGNTPSRFDIKDSSPDVAHRNRPRTGTPVAPRNSRLEPEAAGEPPQDKESQYPAENSYRGRQRAGSGPRNTVRRIDEATERARADAFRRSNRMRITDETVQGTMKKIASRQRVPLKEVPRGFSGGRTQKLKQETTTVYTSTSALPRSISSPKPFSRGRVKVVTNGKPLKRSEDEVSESDNYPPGFLEKLRSKEQSEKRSLRLEESSPRRSRVSQRAAKTYPAIAISEANRLRQRHTRRSTTTFTTTTTTMTPYETDTSESLSEEGKIAKKKAIAFEARRTKYTTPRTTSSAESRPTQYRSHNRRFKTSTPMSVNFTEEQTSTLGPRQIYVSKMRSANRQFKSPKSGVSNVEELEEKKEELQPAENLFYLHQEDKENISAANRKKTIMNIELESEASEEDGRVVASMATEKFTPTTTARSSSTISTQELPKASSSPSTMHRFSSRFSRSNKTIVPVESTTSAPDSGSLVADTPAANPINLTSMFDDASDSTLSIMALFNNSFPASFFISTNKTDSPFTITTARPSTATVNSSTNSPTLTNTTKSMTAKKKPQNKNQKNQSTTTESALNALNNRSILRNLISLFGGIETTTKKNTSRKKPAKLEATDSNATTTTPTTIPSLESIMTIESYINETMKLINNHTGTPANIQTVPRVALNALTPETSQEAEVTQPTTTTELDTIPPATTATHTTGTSISHTTSAMPITTITKISLTLTPVTETASLIEKNGTASTLTASLATTKPSTSENKRNCSSQYLHFDYSSSESVPMHFASSEESDRVASSTESTTSTTADYFVFGVYPNNTVVRRRAWKAFDYERYRSPYVIFGIYPNNTVVKKFPNGTVINDEYLTSENEINDVQGRSSSTERASMTTETRTTVSTVSVTTSRKPTTTAKNYETTTMIKTETGGTTKDIFTGVTETDFEGESPDSMFEFIGNDIEDEEKKDEKLNSMVTDSATTTTMTTTSEDEFLFSVPVSSTIHYTNHQTEMNDVSTETPIFRFIENKIESTTQPFVSTETTESSSLNAQNSERKAKLYSFSDELIKTTTEKSATTTPAESTTQDIFSSIFDALDSSTTVRATKTTNTNAVKESTLKEYGNFLGSSLWTAETTTRAAPTGTTSSDLLGRTESEDFSDSNTGSKTKTEGPGESTELKSESLNILFTTTDRSTTSWPRDVTERDFYLRISDVGDLEFSTTGKTGSEPRETTEAEFLTEINDSVNEYRTTMEKTTTESRSDTIDRIAMREFDLQQLFQPTTMKYDISNSAKLRPTDGPVYRPASTKQTKEESTPSRFLFDFTESPTTTTLQPRFALEPFFELSEHSLFGSTTTEKATTMESLSKLSENSAFMSTTTGRKYSEEATTPPDFHNEEIFADIFRASENRSSETKTSLAQDESFGLMSLAYRALGSSNTITPAPMVTTSQSYITSTMKSTNYKEKKVKMKLKRTSTTTNKPTRNENVFIVTPEPTASDGHSDISKIGKIKFVTLTPVVTTDFRDENDIMTMSSQHVQKVTKAPANIPDNFLTSVVGKIQEKSSSPIPEILKNVEKELQGNGISVSLARRIIEMAIERAVTTEIPQTTGETAATTPLIPKSETTTPAQTTETTAVRTTFPSSTPVPTMSTTHSIIVSNIVSTTYNDVFSDVNIKPLSVGFGGDDAESTTKKTNGGDLQKLVQGVRKEAMQTMRPIATTTPKPSKKNKSLRNSAAAAATLSENDKLLLEAILKQQNSNLSVDELDKIIENQIRLAEEVRKASKNMKRPRVKTTTTTTTTTQTPPLFGFLISLFSGNSSPSNIPVTRAPIKQTRPRLKSTRVPGSMSNTPKSNNPDPFKEMEEGIASGERSTRGELVTAAIDVTKAVSKFMGTFISSAAQSFQEFFSNFGRGR